MDFHVLGGGEIPDVIRNRVEEICETIVYPDEGEITFVSCKSNSLAMSYDAELIRRAIEENAWKSAPGSSIATHTGCLSGELISCHTLRHSKHLGYFLPQWGGFQNAQAGFCYFDPSQEYLLHIPSMEITPFENTLGKRVFFDRSILRKFKQLFYGDGLFVAGENELVFLAPSGCTYLRKQEERGVIHLSLFQSSDAQMQSTLNAVLSEDGKVVSLESVCVHMFGVGYSFQGSEMIFEISTGQGPYRCFWQLPGGARGAADIGSPELRVKQDDLAKFGQNNLIHNKIGLALQLFDELPNLGKPRLRHSAGECNL